MQYHPYNLVGRMNQPTDFAVYSRDVKKKGGVELPAKVFSPASTQRSTYSEDVGVIHAKTPSRLSIDAARFLHMCACNSYIDPSWKKRFSRASTGVKQVLFPIALRTGQNDLESN